MTDVVHFGVKGMHWGVRKTAATAPAKTTRKTVTLEQRAAKRRIRNQRLALAGAALIVAGPELMRHSVNVLNSVAGAKREQAGRQAAQNMFSDANGIPSYSTVNLSFNQANNTWE